ncbi:MAG: hypothetical protein GVY16_01010 [Planctomycetes bacterium]|jgi:hypothetical protein|nr:hypothetical protein [Phycisphaerae bacterium]NBB94305.1 hypothetical protein [Planctomycetota bacterium]
MFEKRQASWLWLVAALALLIVWTPARTDETPGKGSAPAARDAEADAPAEASALDGPKDEKEAAPKAPPKSEAEQWYDKLESAYMNARWDEYVELDASGRRHLRELTRQHRVNAIYMKKTAREFRPGWWEKCRSASNISFKAEIWNRHFTANYMPSDMLGIQAPVGIDYDRRGRPYIQVIVSWRPLYIDNPKPLGEEDIMNIYGLTPTRSKEFGFSLGTMAETIVWHELGHNYITISLNTRAVLKLYRNHGMLYRNMQEFYADMTALYHTSPKSRLFTMMFRLNSLDPYDPTECHARGCAHGCGALLLHEMLQDPEKWPSVHWPGKVPEKNAEIEAIKYVYSHIEPTWTLSEDRELRDFVGKWLRRHGEKALRKRGKWTLSSRLPFNIMPTEDRQAQAERDAWVKKQLQNIIDSGLADDPKVYEEDKKRQSKRVIIIRRPDGDDDDD